MNRSLIIKFILQNLIACTVLFGLFYLLEYIFDWNVNPESDVALIAAAIVLIINITMIVIAMRSTVKKIKDKN